MGASPRFLIALDVQHEGHEPCVEWLDQHDAIPVFPGVWLLKGFPGHSGDIAQRLDHAASRIPLFVVALHREGDFAGHLMPASVLRELDLFRAPPRAV
jgi:hypothetical protein